MATDLNMGLVMSDKALLKKVLVNTYLLLPHVVRARLCRNKVTILLYHEISADLFDSHLHFLTKRYNIIRLERFKQALYKENNEKLPPNSLVITFDDGWKSNYDLLPVIKKYDVPVTIFLATGLVDSCRKIWNYTLDRKGIEQSINDRLKNMPNQEKNKFLLKHNGYFPEKEYDRRVFLSVTEIEYMSTHVDFQSHGQFHPVFTMCSDEELLREMVDSKKYIEDTFGHECYAIAYPYGLYDEKVNSFACQSGYRVGRVANCSGLNTVATDPYHLKAIGVFISTDIRQLQEYVAWAELSSLGSGLMPCSASDVHHENFN